jgi:hypothetical protein
MKANVLMLSAAAAMLTFTGTSFAGGPPVGVGMGGPPPSVTMGPPAGVGMGPPAAAVAHIPSGVPLGQPSVPQRSAASSGVTIGGSVSASAHSKNDTASIDASTSDQADVNAADELGKLNAAHASAKAMVHASSKSIVGEIATYKSAMQSALALTDATAEANAITAARQQLASTSNKKLTVSAVTKIDGMLGISGADPALGTMP